MWSHQRKLTSTLGVALFTGSVALFYAFAELIPPSLDTIRALAPALAAISILGTAGFVLMLWSFLLWTERETAGAVAAPSQAKME